jgi:hypothetical protein
MSYIYIRCLNTLNSCGLTYGSLFHTVSTTDISQDLIELAEILVDGSHGLGPSGSVVILQDT